MPNLIRVAAAASLSFLLFYGGTAQACYCDGLCTKVASPSVIGPTYPATVTFSVTPACAESYNCGCINSMMDTLVPNILPELQAPAQWCFPQNFSYWPAQTQTYSITLTWDQCTLLGQPANDGTGNYILSSSFLASGVSIGGAGAFSCKTDIVCKPKPPPPDEGCTATVGYWKTHSSGRKYDSTWASVGGPNAPFFDRGETWLEVASSPTATDKYYILARQYVAAVLNGFAGASVPADVQKALDWAVKFFAGQETDDFLTDYAALLDRYNNGLAGPPHCE